MIEGSCHCGAVRFTLKSDPQWLIRCNCSICRRYGALWASVEQAEVLLVAPAGMLTSYTTGDENRAFHSCARCGGATHWTPLEPDATRMSVNANLVEPQDIAHLTIRRFDGADSWSYMD